MTQAPPVTLADFLRARLDEDEKGARLAVEAAPAPWEVADRGWMASLYCEGSDERMIVLEQDAVPGRKTPGDVLLFVADHDPARVLAEVEAKRRIVKMHGTDDAWCDYCSGHSVASSECPTIRLLALPYAGHSDYRPEWAL